MTSPIVRLEADDAFELRVGRVIKRIGDTNVEMLAYNGSIPGPTLRVKQGSRLVVDVHNEAPLETTVHWHGLRLENRFDGVPNLTQEPIPPGGHYRHHLVFPDPGLYWYHPHIREDYAQELGLYGNILVDPEDPGYWPAVDREVVLTLDDILIEAGAIAPFDPHGATHTAMGRFGNVLLIGGEPHRQLVAETGEVVRFYLTNTANTRVFKIGLPGARMKLLGGDSGRYEREQVIDDVILAPSERAIVDVVFDVPGSFELQHLTPSRAYTLASVLVAADGRRSTGSFERLRVNADMTAEHERSRQFLAAAPDKTLALVAEMDFDQPSTDGPLQYVCPMHPQVVQEQAGSCPLCGMKLMPRAAGGAAAETSPSPPGIQPGHAHDDAMADGIEWEDLMPEVNRTTNTTNMRWKLVDRETGAENAAIRWTFQTGSPVKIRLVNEMASDHPMHHPFHVHGQRFLVLSRDGVEERNVVWKDTVLIRTGETVDILMDASNPGWWMAHCHIAEHMETGMMLYFQVAG